MLTAPGLAVAGALLDRERGRRSAPLTWADARAELTDGMAAVELRAWATEVTFLVMRGMRDIILAEKRDYYRGVVKASEDSCES